MNCSERPVLFECSGEELVGVIAVPDHLVTDVALLVVVGGPQYRVGSHRQFLLLSRDLARSGVACMRFDFRGCGDSTGEARDFRCVEEDIHAALTCLLSQVPGVRRVVLWGLCDGASAVCLYGARSDERVAGVVLLNPWLESDEAEHAQVVLRHYYLRRVMDGDFWRRLIRGGMGWRSLRTALRVVHHALGQRRSSRSVADMRLDEAMLAGLCSLSVPVLLVLSGRDLTARRFEHHAMSNARWRAQLERFRVEHLREADHTFSRREWRDQVAAWTLDWLLLLANDADGMQQSAGPIGRH
ncbi:hydrolase 1, exosortase A system-associated [Ectothiorhodospira variabilis]|uniref:hydrolase 1, exosortase A system-associated n=1 Tax=Ectothiorhodospira variabilis TaxID=505694 RepID=UPI001EFBCCC0|nr:hydrolase 1, exosortase A system-associated [Ectothiorhodospira variabilis]MCG5497527.1 hydrolase 1, exosortase A system-associated [Ectothiorhodospira variabilis]